MKVINGLLHSVFMSDMVSNEPPKSLVFPISLTHISSKLIRLPPYRMLYLWLVVASIRYVVVRLGLIQGYLTSGSKDLLWGTLFEKRFSKLKCLIIHLSEESILLSFHDGTLFKGRSFFSEDVVLIILIILIVLFLIRTVLGLKGTWTRVWDVQSFLNVDLVQLTHEFLFRKRLENVKIGKRVYIVDRLKEYLWLVHSALWSVHHVFALFLLSTFKALVVNLLILSFRSFILLLFLLNDWIELALSLRFLMSVMCLADKHESRHISVPLHDPWTVTCLIVDMIMIRDRENYVANLVQANDLSLWLGTKRGPQPFVPSRPKRFSLLQVLAF